LPPAPGSADRDGNWLDKWGACKVCDGEIPHGHTNNCDIYKLECTVRRYEQLLRRVLEWCDTDSPNFEIDADVVRAALNPQNRYSTADCGLSPKVK
jgi:hypothetical protein